MSRNSWVGPHAPKPGARARVFLFPFAGGGAGFYRPWAGELPAEVDAVAVRLPGREGRFSEAPIARLDALVAELASGLAPLFDLPFVFFGHSMGGLISFELARRLRDLGGAQPSALFVSASRSPRIPSRRRALHALPTPELVAELRDYGGTPASVLDDAELLDLVLPTLRADFAMCETYAYRAAAPLSCAIHAHGGRADAGVSEAELLAWRAETTGACDVRLSPGGHFYLADSRAEVVARLGEVALDVARAGRAPRAP